MRNKCSIESDVLRERIYKSYVTARDTPLAPSNTEGLRSREPYLCQIVSKHFPDARNARILDLGCGHGALVHFAQSAGYRSIEGVDGSMEQVSAAKSLGIEKVRYGDIQETLDGIESATYDVIITIDVIEHLRADELIPLVDGIWRVLRKKGRWIVHTPNGESPFFGAVLYGDLTHHSAFTKKSIEQLCYSSGFSSVQAFEDSPIPHGVVSFMRRVVWMLVRGVMRLVVAAETGDLSRHRIFSRNFLAVVVK